MLRENAKVMGQFAQVLDLGLIALGFVGTILIYKQKTVILTHIPVEYTFIFCAYLVYWLLCANASGVYESRRATTLTSGLMSIAQAHFFATALVLITATLLDPDYIHDHFMYYFVALSVLFTVVGHLVVRYTLNAIRRSGYNVRYVVVVGNGRAARIFLRYMRRNNHLGYRVLGYVASEKTSLKSYYLGNHEDLKTILKTTIVDLVVITEPILENGVQATIDLLAMMGKNTAIFTDEMASNPTRFQPVQIGGLQMIGITTHSRNGWHEIFKELFDIVFASLALLIASPVMIAVAIAIKATSKGPAFFVQERVGYNGRTFKMYKFRSMVQDAEELKARLLAQNEMSGPVFKITNDPRVTKVGRFIRKTSLDELPQLFNVLKGDMSIVGPRPPLPSEVNLYDPKHRKRLSVSPGITCIWQISGRNGVDFDEWMEMDAEYVDTWSFWLDVKIVLKTIPAVLGKRGAS